MLLNDEHTIQEVLKNCIIFLDTENKTIGILSELIEDNLKNCFNINDKTYEEIEKYVC